MVPFGMWTNNFTECKILLKINHRLLFDGAARYRCPPQIFISLLSFSRVSCCRWAPSSVNGGGQHSLFPAHLSREQVPPLRLCGLEQVSESPSSTVRMLGPFSWVCCDDSLNWCWQLLQRVPETQWVLLHYQLLLSWLLPNHAIWPSGTWSLLAWNAWSE